MWFRSPVPGTSMYSSMLRMFCLSVDTPMYHSTDYSTLVRYLVLVPMYKMCMILAISHTFFTFKNAVSPSRTTTVYSVLRVLFILITHRVHRHRLPTWCGIEDREPFISSPVLIPTQRRQHHYRPQYPPHNIYNLYLYCVIPNTLGTKLTRRRQERTLLARLVECVLLQQ